MLREQKIKILKYYLRKKLEENALTITLPGETTLTAELQKGINQPNPIGQQELEKIKEAIKVRYPEMNSFESKEISNSNPRLYSEISFEKSGTPTNFKVVIRKIANPTNRTQFKYAMWYVPFNEREDIDKPGAVQKKESDPFDAQTDISSFLNTIYEFFLKALLMN